MTFTEANTVEAFLRDRLAGPVRVTRTGTVAEPPSAFGLGWRYVAATDFPRQLQDVLVEGWTREGLIRLNRGTPLFLFSHIQTVKAE